MNKKAFAVLGLKLIALTFILSISFFIAALVSGMATPPADSTQAPADAGSELLTFLAVFLLEAAILAYFILRSRWHGWRLVAAIFLAFFGVNTVVAQIESIVYLPHQLPPGMVPKLFLMGAIVAGLFSPLAVLILGKMRRAEAPQGPNPRSAMPPGEWAWKLAGIAVIYVIIYFIFGYFIAWKHPAVQAYYSGTDPGSFLAQLGRIWETTPWLFLLQVLRAILWTLFALPVIRMLEGHSWEVALAIAVLFAVWSSQLLLPNPYMPEAVARTHLVETVSSNLLFGWLVGWLLNRHHSSLRDIFTGRGVLGN